jgi:uroporphyrinogen decarboxylase
MEKERNSPIAKAPTGRERLQQLLSGDVPDAPPHWELVFQIPQELFGLDRKSVEGAVYGSEAARKKALRNFHFEVSERLLAEFDWAALPALNSYDHDEVAEMKNTFAGRALVPGYEGQGVFWMPNGEGMLDFAIRLYEQRDELQAEARRKCNQAKTLLRQLADAGADFFVLAYDFGFNRGPFISPAHFRELVTPYLTEIVQCAHDLGKIAILHSDGCLTEILDQIHDTGLDGYQSVDPQGGMDIRVVREKYPNWLLMGNVPCNLLQETDEPQIRNAVRYCMRHGGVGKRYIFSTSNCLFAGMPPDSYRLMFEEYRTILKTK